MSIIAAKTHVSLQGQWGNVILKMTGGISKDKSLTAFSLVSKLVEGKKVRTLIWDVSNMEKGWEEQMNWLDDNFWRNLSSHVDEVFLIIPDQKNLSESLKNMNSQIPFTFFQHIDQVKKSYSRKPILH